MSLTVHAVKQAKPQPKPYKLSDAGGLYLHVLPTGSKVWRANYRVGGRNGLQRTRTYGHWPEVSLAQARIAHEQAKTAHRLLSDSLDSGQTTPDLPTFEQVARSWLEIKLPGLANPKHQLQVENTLKRFVFPSIGARPIDQIPRAMLIDIVHAVQNSGDSASVSRVETAHRVAGRITAVFDHALDLGLIRQHRAASLVHVLQPRKVRKPMVSIPPEEAGVLLRAIDEYHETITRLGLHLLALTFVRVGELRGMRWDELREEGRVWVIPSVRTKAGLPHVVPLSRQAMAVLEQLRPLTGGRELLLESPLRRGCSLSENTFLFALYRLGYRGRMTAHGFRALASTVLHEESGFSSDVIERQLAHRETDAVRAAYNRAQYLDQRRALMQWWGDWLDRQRRDGRQGSTANRSFG